MSVERWTYVIDFYWSNINPKIPYDYNEAVSLIPKILQQNKNNFFDTLAVIRMFASYVFDPYLVLSNPCTKYGIDFARLLTQAKENNIPKTEAWLQLPPFKSLFWQQNHRIDRAFYNEQPINNFGTCHPSSTPLWATNRFRTKNYPSRQLFFPNEHSLIVHKMNELDLPFCAGPSQATAKIIFCMLLLCDVTTTELQAFANFYAACNIANGYHSMFEIALPFMSLGIFSTQDESCSYTDAREFYIKFLMPNLQQLPECNELLTEFMNLPRLPLPN